QPPDLRGLRRRRLDRANQLAAEAGRDARAGEPGSADGDDPRPAGPAAGTPAARSGDARPAAPEGPTPVSGMKITELFFDRKAVTSRVDKATRKVLSRFGAFVRRTARSSIRKRKKTSQPGSPPSS